MSEMSSGEKQKALKNIHRFFRKYEALGKPGGELSEQSPEVTTMLKIVEALLDGNEQSGVLAREANNTARQSLAESQKANYLSVIAAVVAGISIISGLVSALLSAVFSTGLSVFLSWLLANPK
jgi:hypothetical protein